MFKDKQTLPAIGVTHDVMLSPRPN